MSIEIYHPETARRVAGQLLDIAAIKLSPEQPFTWASGWKSPIYCDNRLSLSFPEVRKFITQALAELINAQAPHVQAIAGVATAGIPQGVLVADALDLPFLYIRSKSKEHGMGNQIEGRVVEGQKVVLIEDLVSTGGSSLQAASTVRAANMEVLGMAAIFTYGFEIAERNFARDDIRLWCLSDYSHLLELAIARGLIKEELLATLQAWRTNPGTWMN